MATLRTWCIALALAAGFAVVLAGPAWLLWEYMLPETWDAGAVEIKFETVRLDRGALVFTYQVSNRTRWKARLLPDAAELKVLQPQDLPPLGYAVMRLPLDLAAHSSQRVELRLELPSPRSVEVQQPPAVASFQQFVEDTLRELQGFELVDPVQGIRLVFPRGW